MLTQERLKDVLAYFPEAGVFVWKQRVADRIKVGDTAGSRHNKTGYLRIRLDGKEYLSHRLAWFYSTGVWPVEIDHINRNQLDNRIDNLRDVSHSVNINNRNYGKNKL